MYRYGRMCFLMFILGHNLSELFVYFSSSQHGGGGTCNIVLFNAVSYGVLVCAAVTRGRSVSLKAYSESRKGHFSVIVFVLCMYLQGLTCKL